jgi:hypothetical protein
MSSTDHDEKCYSCGQSPAPYRARIDPDSNAKASFCLTHAATLEVPEALDAILPEETPIVCEEAIENEMERLQIAIMSEMMFGPGVDLS